MPEHFSQKTRYTSMNYLVQGWNIYRFLLSPDELRQILSPYHLVIFNAHVPKDYVESTLDEYIAAYSSLYNLLISGEKIIRQRDYPLFLHRGATSDLSNCLYGRFHLYEGQQYKSAEFREPVVGISPVALYIRIDDDKKLHCSTACSYSFYSEDYMGIALEYPKMIQYRFGDDYEALKSTETLNSYQDFIRLRDSIKKITRPLSIKAAGVERRLNIRVSDVVRYQLNGCYSFRTNGVIVK